VRSDWDGNPDPLALLRQGLPENFERFVHLESPSFLGFFRRLGASSSEAEDLFLRLLRGASGYREHGRFLPFCFRVARNLWIDHERRRAARPLQAIAADEEEHWSDPAQTGDAASARLEQQDQAQRLLQALGELSPSHRAAFELAIVQERPYSEIALLLSIPVGTVKSRVFYCLQLLRQRLGDLADAPPSGAPSLAPLRQPATPDPR
jgi:RNA polymerase sigma factor (sigma-70 family)